MTVDLKGAGLTRGMCDLRMYYVPSRMESARGHVLITQPVSIAIKTVSCRTKSVCLRSHGREKRSCCIRVHRAQFVVGLLESTGGR